MYLMIFEKRNKYVTKQTINYDKQYTILIFRTYFLVSNITNKCPKIQYIQT